MPDPAKPPTSAEDPLHALGERLQAAQETAERLVREATAAANESAGEAGEAEGAPGERPPPRGYASPRTDRGAGAEAQALVALLDLARAVVPPELRAQLLELVREVLLAVRALIDWYLERVEARRQTPVEVEDIPIS